MIATAYSLPFRFVVPTDNPWDGRRRVELAVAPKGQVDEAFTGALRLAVARFWQLAAVGGLGGDVVAPWSAACREPVLMASFGAAVFHFDGWALDEKATCCLLALLLGAEVPVAEASLTVGGSRLSDITGHPRLDDPYPAAWPQLPFPAAVEASESETRVLIAHFASPLGEEPLAAAERILLNWGDAAAAGAFAVAPVPPVQSGCIVTGAVEHYEGELTWALEKCRFHPRAAFDSLVAVCAAIHHRVAPIAEVVVE